MSSDNVKGKEGDGVQGEGNYAAGWRYNKAVREHVETADVEGEARKAKPESADVEAELERAEDKGRERAKEQEPASGIDSRRTGT